MHPSRKKIDLNAGGLNAGGLNAGGLNAGGLNAGRQTSLSCHK